MAMFGITRKKVGVIPSLSNHSLMLADGTLSAAGASVGLGNIWRFPYLAAKYGGGIFLLIYIILAFTFGYTMIVAETALGRMTRKSPVGAFAAVRKGRRSFGGWINAIIPILIVPYYSVIGGWVIRYLADYISGHGTELATDGYFSAFISSGASAEICFVIFTIFTLAIIFAGVRNGVERVSKVMMPILVVLSVIIAGYSVTRPGALEGVKYFLVPNLSNFSWMTVVTAMGQMFYSLSIAMGILVTFGSYMKKDVSIEESTENVEIFDTAIAIMAGLMIIFLKNCCTEKLFSCLRLGSRNQSCTLPLFAENTALSCNLLEIMVQ